MNRPFFDTIKALDKIIQRGIAGKQSFNELADLLTTDQYRRYFYGTLNDPAWLKVLTLEGEMNQAPAAEIDVETSKHLGYRGWPQMDYLKKIAPLCPEDVVEILKNVKDNGNHWVHSGTVQAAINMPPVEAAKLVPTICAWLRESSSVSFTDDYASLIILLAEGGEINPALRLTRSLLTLQKSTANKSYRNIRGIVDDWDYERVLESIIQPLTKYAGTRAFELIVDLLAEGFSFAKTSLTWPPAIENHQQNEMHREPLDLLVFACRDSSSSLVDRDSKAVFSILSNQSQSVFKRIEIYLLTQNPKIAPTRLEQLFADTETYRNLDLHHEVYHFLRQHFTELSESNREKYFSVIDAVQGPEDEADSEKREEIRDFRRYHKLYPIQGYLDEKRESTFKRFASRFHELEHPDFLVYTSSAVFVGEEKSADYYDLSGLSDAAIISRHSTLDFGGAGSLRDGFAAGLYDVVTEDVHRLPALLQCFGSVGLRHSDAFFRRLRETIGGGEALPTPIWYAVLTLVTNHANLPEDNEKLTNVRKAIANCLSAGLDKTETEIPIEFRKQVSKILSDLSEDPNPTIDEESQEESSYGNLAINTVRGVAIQATMQFGLWLYRNSDKGGIGGSLKWKGLSTDELLKSTLERHLDPNQDPSLTIRSVYGRMIPWLILMDEEWVKDNLEVLFPKSKAMLKHRRAAWGTYVAFCRPYDNVVSLLREEYHWATTQIGTWDGDRAATFDADERLAEHIMLMYWDDVIDLKSEILQAFMSESSDQLRGTAISFMARSLKYLKIGAKESAEQRLMDLWESRIASIEALETKHPGSGADEATAFGEWFASGAFKPKWSLLHLAKSLKYASPKYRDIDIVRRLSTLSDKNIVEVVDCLGMLVELDTERRFSGSWIDDVRSILSKGVRTENDDVREKSIGLVHKLGERGIMKLRDLLQE